MVERVSFTGGMNAPAAFGRMNATIPLAELVLDDRTLRLRPRAFARLMMTEFATNLDQIAAAYPLRGRIMTSGVGFTLHDGTAVYFWTNRKRDAVLRELHARGVPVEEQPRSASQVWRFRRNTSSATLPTLPRPLQFLIPALLVCGTLAMLGLLASATSWWFRLWVIFVWAFSIVATVPLWLRGRNRRT